MRQKTKLTSQQENELYFKQLTSMDILDYYIDNKVGAEIAKCYNECLSLLQIVKTREVILGIEYRLSKLETALKELDNFTELEKLDAEIEQELLNIAMYGQYND